MMQRVLSSVLALALAALLGAGPGVYTGAGDPGASWGGDLQGMCSASPAGHALGGGRAQPSRIALPATRGNEGVEPELEREGPTVLAHVDHAPVLAWPSGSPRGPETERSRTSSLYLLDLTSHPPTAPPQHA